MAALRAAGSEVASAKVGPDFIDPGYHALATGRAPRNLDPWICGPDAMGPLAARAGAGADITIIEGVMGLFDGSVDGEPTSTADVAVQLGAPVVLVVDGSSMSASVAALVAGYRDHYRHLDLRAVILNRVGSEHHRQLLTEALATIDMPVLGALPRNDAFRWRDRHLGLVPVDEDRAAVSEQLQALGSVLADAVDLEDLVRLATSAPAVSVPPLPTPASSVAAGASESRSDRPKPIVAVAGGPAFTFVYRDNIEALEAAGAEVVSFDPLSETELPPGATGLVAGGGFPEVFAEALTQNQPLLDDLRAASAAGLVMWAECGGLLWLSRSLRPASSAASASGPSPDLDPDRAQAAAASVAGGHRLAGLVEADGVMSERLTLGYREALVRTANPVAAAGTRLRGHEFHYSTIEPGGDALALKSRFNERHEGFASPQLLATYLHLHLGADPAPAQRFVSHAAAVPKR